jgi:hypothetical protein
MPVIYLLHFERPICETHNRDARHYLGYAASITSREAEHRSGGARAVGMTRAAAERGIGFSVARIWGKADKRLEYRLRALHNNPQLCPICNPGLQLECRPLSGGGYRMVRHGPRSAVRFGDPVILPPYRPKPRRQRVRSDGTSNAPAEHTSVAYFAEDAAPFGVHVSYTSDDGDQDIPF